MSRDAEPVPLSGGHVSLGVVRVGDTVRRPVGPHTRSVHRLLRHLEWGGFAQAPRVLGHDEEGREVLSFILGSTDVPDDLWTGERALVASARLLRALHDVTASYQAADDDTWAYAYPDRSRHEVVCHNDFAPYNLVFQDGLPVGVIDFDLAGPGPRLRDLAYLAYWMTPLSFGSADLAALTEAQARSGWPRLRLLCSTYGTDDYAALLLLVSEVLHHMGSQAVAVAMLGQDAAQRLEDGQHLAHWRAEAGAFDAQLPGLRLALR